MPGQLFVQLTALKGIFGPTSHDDAKRGPPLSLHENDELNTNIQTIFPRYFTYWVFRFPPFTGSRRRRRREFVELGIPSVEATPHHTFHPLNRSPFPFLLLQCLWEDIMVADALSRRARKGVSHWVYSALRIFRLQSPEEAGLQDCH